MSLKQKTINGLFWSFFDKLAAQSITFIVGIILARILSPAEFGLMGMIMIFIAIADSFINSGFSQALIQKKNCTDTDFSTAFYFNLSIGVLTYIILFSSASAISNFFNEPELFDIIRIISIILIIDAIAIVQRTILTKRINFKLQTKISIIAALISGAIGIFMALNGYGVWSLVVKFISLRSINALLLWVWNRWLPKFVFSKSSFKQLFSFGSKLLISGLIDTIYKNIYYFIIGKYFSAKELGFYTRADQFKKLPSENLSTIISRVSFPVLSTLQDEEERLKEAYKKLIKNTMFISFTLLIGLATIAEPLIITLIGEKWQPSIIYLQLLCMIGMIFPLHALNLNILKVKGRSDLFLKIEIIKKVLSIPVIVIGIFLGVKIMIIGMIVHSVVAFFINSFYTQKLINYSRIQQIKDIIPSLILSFLVAFITYSLRFVIEDNLLILLISQFLIFALLIVVFSEVIKFDSYLYIKEIVLNYKKNLTRK